MPRLEKGSQAARDRMAHLRSLRKKKGGSEPKTPMQDPESSSDEEEGTGLKTQWIRHVTEYAKKNNMNYFQALKDPKVKIGYKKK